jgi:hypothetical protein
MTEYQDRPQCDTSSGLFQPYYQLHNLSYIGLHVAYLLLGDIRLELLKIFREIPDNYLVLSSIGFNKASEYVYDWYSASGVNYMTCKAKIKEKLTWFDCNKHF